MILNLSLLYFTVYGIEENNFNLEGTDWTDLYKGIGDIASFALTFSFLLLTELLNSISLFPEGVISLELKENLSNGVWGDVISMKAVWFLLLFLEAISSFGSSCIV